MPDKHDIALVRECRTLRTHPCRISTRADRKGRLPREYFRKRTGLRIEGSRSVIFYIPAKEESGAVEAPSAYS
jgi:hypothetical protein